MADKYRLTELRMKKNEFKKQCEKIMEFLEVPIILFKESGNVEIVCSFAYAALEWKFMYI
jgi:hypothetical protein